jgi:hypothetical protein
MNLRCYYILTGLGLFFIAATAAAKSDLATPEKRREFIDQATELGRPVAPVPLPAGLKNPFVLSRDDSVGVGVKQLAGDRQVLEALAPHIAPSGVVTQVDGSPMLLLGEKKLKVGEYLTITFEGTVYMVEVSAISHSSFTLRLNKEEITQPINP